MPGVVRLDELANAYIAHIHFPVYLYSLCRRDAMSGKTLTQSLLYSCYSDERCIKNLHTHPSSVMVLGINISSLCPPHALFFDPRASHQHRLGAMSPGPRTGSGGLVWDT